MGSISKSTIEQFKELLNEYVSELNQTDTLSAKVPAMNTPELVNTPTNHVADFATWLNNKDLDGGQ